MMERDYQLDPNERKQWENFYQQILTQSGQESVTEEDGTKSLVLLPMLTYTLISTMLQKLKYLPDDCFNRMTIGGTPICGLRQINQNSSATMIKLTEILRVMMDGVRKQHILSVTMIFYQKNNIKQVYDCYSLVFDYETKLSNQQSSTSVETIAHIIHQIEYMFDWNDAFPNDVELTFAMSVRDQFHGDEQRVPSPFNFIKPSMKNVYENHETKYFLGRLTTVDGKILLKFLPNNYQLSGSTIRSEDLPTRENILGKKSSNKLTKQDTTSKLIARKDQDFQPLVSPKLKKKTKRSLTSNDSNKTLSKLPSMISAIPAKLKKKSGFLNAVKSLITPSRTPAPISSSTPNPNNIVLIPHTSTPKPGETASRITIGNSSGIEPLSAIQESSTTRINQSIHVESPTLSTFTTANISPAMTSRTKVDSQSSTPVRTPTLRSQATMARKRIAQMQIRDDSSDDNDKTDDEDENEEFIRLFNKRKTKKVPKPTIVLIRTTKNQSDISSISSTHSNVESLLTPPSARKRPTTDRTDVDDLVLEHGTPPKTPRTARRNRNLDESTSQMDIGDLHVTVDSPRLLRSVTKKLQKQASEKKRTESDTEKSFSEKSQSQGTITNESDIDRAHVGVHRSFVGLHYSMEESD